MWKLAYNVGVYCAFPFFVVLALAKKKIRKTLLERMYVRKAPEMHDVLWIHAASVGEAVIAENFVNFMHSRMGAGSFAITTNTDYTYRLLNKKLAGRARVLYLPFDLPCVIKRFMNDSTFKALILVETEIWPNVVWAAHSRGIPVLIMNGRISDRTVKNYRALSFFLKHVLSSIDLVLAQSEEQAARFVSVGMDRSRVRTTGNLKYYRFFDHRPETEHTEEIITFGSIKEKELPVILPLIEPLKKRFPDRPVYLVPRDLALVNAVREGITGTLRVCRFSELKAGKVRAPDVVVVDTMGDLMSIYQRSLVAFVGGSLAPYGGQNILEPLFFGAPVLFGPHIENFREIADRILSAGAGRLVQDGNEVFETIRDLINNPDLRRAMGEAGLQVIREQEAAMTTTVDAVTEVLWKNSTA